MTKKVVLILVEGEAEETVLTEYLEEVFGTEEVFIDVQNGDILTDWHRDKNIKNTLGEVIKAYLKKTKFKASDLKWVFQITDSDGVFIPNENIKINAHGQDELFYDESTILVSDEKKKRQIEKRNEQKSKNIKILKTTSSFNLERVKIPFKIYYFSTNLDHVLWDERNEMQNQKTAKAEDFIENLGTTLEEFLWQYSAVAKSELSEQSYIESWNKLSSETNSLKRLTNITLLFELARCDEGEDKG